MAKSSNYRVQLRRRREGKTDYQARKALVISGRPRLVTRTSIKNANAQIIIAKPTGDQTVAAANSRELIKKYGWRAPTGNLPAAYLTGLLCGLKAKAAGINEAILDLGLINPTKGAKVFAVLHGVIDAGVEIPHGDEKIVAARSKGDHIGYYANELDTEEPQVYTAKFTKYTDKGIAPEKIAGHFSIVRTAIASSFKGVTIAPEPPSAPAPKSKPKTPPKTEAKPTPKPEIKTTPVETPKTEATITQPKLEPPTTPKTETKPPAKPPTPKTETKPAPELTEPKADVKAEEPKTKAKTTPKAPKEEVKPVVKTTIKTKASAEKKDDTPMEKAPKEKTPKVKPVGVKTAPVKVAPEEKVKATEKPKKAPAKAKTTKSKAKTLSKEKVSKEKLTNKKAASKTKVAKEKAPAKKAAAKKGEKKA